MSETKPIDPLVLPLIEPITGHTVIREVRLRRPSAREILSRGYPYTVQSTADGRSIFIENDDAIAFYCEACIADGQDKAGILAQLGMEDTLALRERVIDFFIAAEMKKRGFAASSTGSSSGSAGSPTSSSA